MQIDLYREKFMAIPEKPKFNNGFSSKYYAEDPHFTVFSLFFEFTSPLLNPESGKGESAERFFKLLGDENRRNKTVEFRERLLHLIDQTPYLIRSVDGLGDVYDYTAKEIYNEREITFKTYETLDFRIAKLVELYTDIVWDFEMQKRILPENLEWINYHVIVNDIRELVSFVNSGEGESKMENITKHLNSFVFSFKNAKFSFVKSNGFLSTISNEEPSVSDNSFMIIGGKFSKKKNRIILSNTGERKTGDITGRRTTDGTSKIEKISTFRVVAGILKDAVIDYARKEGAQLASELVFDPLKSGLFDLLNQNSFYNNSGLDLSDVVTGKQKLKDFSVEVSTDNSSADKKIRNTILNKEKIEYNPDTKPEIPQYQLVDIKGMSNEELINIILNDVNRRLAYGG